MKRKIAILAIVISMAVLLSGCWNRKELDELGIVLGLGIDKVDDEYLVTLQVVSPGDVASKTSSGQRTPFVVYQEKGENLFEAIRRVTTISPRKMYLAHLRIVIIGEELAREGISEALDFLSRDHQLRSDYFIAVSKETRAEHVLKILTSLENIPANKLYSSLETSEKAWAPTFTVTLDDLIADLVSDGINAKLTGVIIQGDIQRGEHLENVQQTKDRTELKYEGIGVFKGDKLAGWLDEDESKGLTYSLGEVESTIVKVKCRDQGKAGIEIVRSNGEIKAQVNNEIPKGTITVQAEGNVGEVECRSLDLTKANTLTQLEKKVEEDIKTKIEKTVSAAKEKYESDLFGFGEALHRSHPDYWKKAKKEWAHRFAEMPVEVKVNVTIRGVGTIVDSPLNKMKDE
ncbi:spore gernimation protein GerC [Sporosarcina globispora]|uniref:Spore gernimation protein GerC n=1 Tax=Sporosarcina globispora TaxID=1459 RepID=A0A0M0GDQ8_SPOGL|nr:Ger(x)C family spore germination protein [Sporosarcina globispora]KON88045.1 spore gernimation protein GerC [Sporosarcina globispora]